VGKAKKRWEGIVLSDTSRIAGIREWRRRAEKREELKRLLRETRPQKGFSNVDGWFMDLI